MSKTIVIGGGAAGLMAAGFAAQQGAEVVLLEKNRDLGKKLAITGKGRCNITNACEIEDLIKNMPGNGQFLYGPFYTFTNRDVVDFFNRRGVPTKVERGQRVFPESDQAQDVIKALARFVTVNGGEISCGESVAEIMAEELPEGEGKKGPFKKVTGVKTIDGREYRGDAVIIATGGLSYPGTGSTGDGYKWAEALGHKVTPLKPSLVPLETREEWVKELQGLALRNVKVAARAGQKVLGEEFGEMLFTHFGLSGPVILTLSDLVVAHMEKVREPVTVVINLKTALSREQVDSRLQRDFAANTRKQFKNSLGELLPKSLIPVMIKLSGIAEDKPVHQITRQERQGLVDLLTGLNLTITKPRSIKEAIVTAGGVVVKEVNPKTMESKLVQGLYFAGEVLDIHGYTGGFNLQAAFSTGYVAGVNAAAAGAKDD